MGLRDIGKTLPPGFRFYPSDEELVCHYLHKKIANEEVVRGTLVDIDLHTCEPWQLPDVAKLNSSEWYFFSFRDWKYATGYRTNRATASGYWKATGKDRAVLDPCTRTLVGMRKTLVFYKNRAPNGTKTAWIMHEFRLHNPHSLPKEDWVLCRVFQKSGSGENSHTRNPTQGHITCPNRIPSSRPSYHRRPDLQAQNPSIVGLALSAGVCFPFSHDEDENNDPMEKVTTCGLDDQVTELLEETIKYDQAEDDYGFWFDPSFNYDNIRLDHDTTAASDFI